MPSSNTYTRLTPFQSGKAVTLKHPEDPMCVYNHTIKQINAQVNRVASVDLEYMPTSILYRLVMGRWWSSMRCDEGIMHIFSSLALSFCVGLIPTFNILHMFMWFIAYLIYEYSARTHTRNQTLVDDPFTKMIYSPQICKKAKLMNVYFNYPAPNLESLEIPRGQLDDLLKRESQGYILFMVYDYKFWAAYSHFDRLRWFHYVNIVVTAGAIIFAVFKLYPALGIHEFMFLDRGYYY